MYQSMALLVADIKLHIIAAFITGLRNRASKASSRLQNIICWTTRQYTSCTLPPAHARDKINDDGDAVHRELQCSQIKTINCCSGLNEKQLRLNGPLAPETSLPLLPRRHKCRIEEYIQSVQRHKCFRSFASIIVN